MKKKLIRRERFWEFHEEEPVASSKLKVDSENWEIRHIS